MVGAKAAIGGRALCAWLSEPCAPVPERIFQGLQPLAAQISHAALAILSRHASPAFSQQRACPRLGGIVGLPDLGHQPGPEPVRAAELRVDGVDRRVRCLAGTRLCPRVVAAGHCASATPSVPA
jgi:hypothetical protein